MSERDIVERLREYIPLASYDGVVLAHVATFKEAADGFERLREALTEVMEWIDGWDPGFIYDDDWPATKEKVRAALAHRSPQ